MAEEEGLSEADINELVQENAELRRDVLQPWVAFTSAIAAAGGSDAVDFDEATVAWSTSHHPNSMGRPQYQGAPITGTIYDASRQLYDANTERIPTTDPSGAEVRGMEEEAMDAADAGVTETHTAADAVNFLLNRQQGVLATLNQRIIEEFFNTNMIAQENIIQVNDPSESLLINLLLQRPNLLPFFAIRTPYLSLLVPKIRLFKKVYIRRDDGTYIPRAGTLEFTFKSFTENTEIEQITSTNFGRAGGAGIKSVNWSYEGTNPETVRSFVNFDISLFFQSLSDFVGSDAPSAQTAFETPSSLDLIGLIGAGIGGVDETGQSSFKFEIIAQLGWELDHSINHDLDNSFEIEKLQKILGETNTVLRLSLREHNINFNEDGSLTLDISYFSAIDELFTNESLNVLRIGGQPAIENVLAASSESASPEGSPDGDSPSDAELDHCDTTSRQVTTGDEASGDGGERGPTDRERAIHEALRTTGDDNIIQNYNNIFSKILVGNKIYRVSIDTAEVARQVEDRQWRFFGWSGEQSIRARLFTEQQLQVLSGTAYSVSTVNIDTVLASEEIIEAAAEEAAADAAGDNNTILAEASLNEPYDEALIKRFSDETTGRLMIDFIRLGDLLDGVITGLKDMQGSALQERAADFVFLTGLYTYEDFDTRKAYNYSDMLISIEGFRSFFIEKIVRPLKVNYNLTSFMIDLAKDFSYVNSIRLASHGNFVNPEGRPTLSAFQAPDIDLGAQLRQVGAAEAMGDAEGVIGRWHALFNYYGSLGNNVPVFGGELDGVVPRPSSSGESARELSYFILHSSGHIIERDADEDEDIKVGIYHLKIGSDKGILKSIKFRKDEIAGRREGRIVRAGGLNLTALREKYDATITIFGAPFIFPGTFIYVNPSLIGYGDGPNSAAQILGLGGYYLVNKVSNSISGDGTFETEIEASWNAFAETRCRRDALYIIRAPGEAPQELGAATETPIEEMPIPYQDAQQGGAGEPVGPRPTPAQQRLDDAGQGS